MDQYSSQNLKHVAFVGSYWPRQCGIATFTADLCREFAAQHQDIHSIAIALNDNDAGYAYPAEVRYELRQHELFDYERAADYLNQRSFDVISLQHEYGIFGGDAGTYVLQLLRRVSAPVVTTLHTILETPNPEQQRVMREILGISRRVVVMSHYSRELLCRIYGVPTEKVDLIPHGIPDVAFVDPGFYKDRFEAEGRPVLLTFGLLSRNKGIEYVLDALPAVVESYPNVLYVVQGATHPHVKKSEGEQYRESLLERTRLLGVERNVLFHDEFVALDDLKEFIGAADIYITPYLDREQIVSGTLAYTVGAGKAVISTPYRYAEELLDNGRGILVPFRDSSAIAEKILHLLKNEAERSALRKRAYLYGRDMVWPMVAQQYRQSFDRARLQHVGETQPAEIVLISQAQRTEVPPLSLQHIERLTDETGILQHAVFDVPNYNEGYTTDDNARALIMAVWLEGLSRRPIHGLDCQSLGRVQEMGTRYLAFLWHAFNPKAGRFRNFMSYQRQWLEKVGSEDAHGRAIWALGVVLGNSNHAGRTGLASKLFEAAIPVTVKFDSPRAWAYTLLGLELYLKRHPGDRAASLIQDTLATKLLHLYRESQTPEWPWFENAVTYCNPVLPEALLRYGPATGNNDAISIGLESLSWLVRIQRSDEGYITPIGSRGFYQKGGPISYFDQQPVEIYSLISACLEAARLTHDAAWYHTAIQALGWFFGRNAVNLPLYDPVTGGCRDGLHMDRVNENQGAESTLAYIQSLLKIWHFELESSGTFRTTPNKIIPHPVLTSAGGRSSRVRVSGSLSSLFGRKRRSYVD